MATKTDGLQITHVAAAQSSKTVTLNSALDRIDGALGGFFSQVMPDSTLALTEAQATENMVFNFTGSTIAGTQKVTVPDNVKKIYIAKNSTSPAQTISFETVTGTGPNLSTTAYKILVSDGTDVIDLGTL